MRAEQFIKDRGLEKAREVVEGAPEFSLFYDLERNKHVPAESTSIAMAFLKNRFLPIEDLQRLVESVDLIKFYGGIEKAKLILAMGTCFSERPPHKREVQLKQAIADYESIYGEVNE